MAESSDDDYPTEVRTHVKFDGSSAPEDERRDRSESVVSYDDYDGAAPPDPTAGVDPSTMREALRNALNPPSPIYKIVLTGGPCGGKTTALARLSSYLRERGFEVITCPEAFSILGSNGFSMEYFGTDGMDHVVQGTVMDMQISLEDGFERVLRARGKPAVLLCDRGLMDGAAYMSPEDWNEFLERRAVKNVCELREGRYNAVFHLVTAAEGAERYYTLENNEVRTETPEQARRQDVLSRSAWVGHPKLFVFDNSTDFEGKLQRLVDSAAKLVGLPAHLSRVTTKFLLRSRPNLDAFPEDVKYHIFNVEKVYLYDDVSKKKDSEYKEEYSFVRRRTNIGKDGKRLGSAYGQTTVKRTHDGQAIEVKRIITRREYVSAYKTRDPTRHVIRQKRISFLYNMQSFNVHIYDEPVSDVCILHAQVEASSRPSSPEKNGVSDGGLGAGLGANVDLPPFLDVGRRLQSTKEDEEMYGAFNISRIDKG